MKDYLNSMESLHKFHILSEISKYDNATQKLERLLVSNSGNIEINKARLGLFKAFSPIPVLIIVVEYFTSVIYVDLNKVINKVTTISFSFDRNEWIAIALFGIVFYYGYRFKATWDAYKKLISTQSDIQGHLIISREEADSLERADS